MKLGFFKHTVLKKDISRASNILNNAFLTTDKEVWN